MPMDGRLPEPVYGLPVPVHELPVPVYGLPPPTGDLPQLHLEQDHGVFHQGCHTDNTYLFKLVNETVFH